jgi:hypothetical protein
MKKINSFNDFLGSDEFEEIERIMYEEDSEYDYDYEMDEDIDEEYEQEIEILNEEFEYHFGGREFDPINEGFFKNVFKKIGGGIANLIKGKPSEEEEQQAAAQAQAAADQAAAQTKASEEEKLAAQANMEAMIRAKIKDEKEAKKLLLSAAGYKGLVAKQFAKLTEKPEDRAKRTAFLKKKQTGGPFQGKTNAFILGQAILDIFYAFKFAAPAIYTKVGGDKVYTKMKQTFIPKVKKAVAPPPPADEDEDDEDEDTKDEKGTV